MNYKTRYELQQEKLDEEAEQAAKEHGLLNWRLIGKYPQNWDNLEADSKRWEFLRRNEEYRSDWKIYNGENVTNSPRRTKFKKLKFARSNPIQKITSQKIFLKYGISSPLPPSVSWENRPKGLKFIRTETSLQGKIIYPNDGRKEAPNPPTWSDQKVWIELDLRYSPGKQIENMKNELDEVTAKAERVSWVSNFMNTNTNFADDGLYSENLEIIETGRKLRGANKRPKKQQNNMNDQSMVISLLRICDARISGYKFSIIASKLADIEEGFTDNMAQKRYNFAQKYWERL